MKITVVYFDTFLLNFYRYNYLLW